MKLGGRREFNKVNSSWSARAREEDYADDEVGEDYEEVAEPGDAPAAYTPRVFETRSDELSEDYASVLGPESNWNGNVNTEGSIRIEGNVLGEVRATGTVFISSGADVRATVFGKFVVIEGAFDGNLYCSERLELRPQSRIKGSINTKSLSVGEGAFIDGEIHMGEVDDLATAKPLEAVGAKSGNGRKKDDETDN